MSGPLYGGVDVGSTWTKAVVVDAGGRVAGRGLVRSGLSFTRAAAAARDAALSEAGADAAALDLVVATGYGRENAEFAAARRTEIACHARGAYDFARRACTVVDIGGQDNKVIELREDGAVDHFVLNRKCAAGTGAFIEEIARRLDLELADLERLAEGADRDLTLASYCTVFSATEVIRLIREGERPENLCRGIFNAVVARVAEMAPLGPRVVLTGGVAAAFPVVAQILGRKAGSEVEVPPRAQFVGALGAALEARDEAARARKSAEKR